MARRWIVLASLSVTLNALAVSRAAATPFNDLGSFLAAAGSTTLIDFEHDGLGITPVQHAEIDGTFAGLGIDFPLGNRFEHGFIGPVSGEWGWINDNLVGSDRRFDARFLATGIRAVGVHNVLLSGIPDGSLLRAFDASNNLIESVLSDADGTTKDFFGLVTNADIARFEVLVLRAQGWGLDDLYFGRAAVPEPGLLGLIGAGLVGLGVFRRRNR